MVADTDDTPKPVKKSTRAKAAVTEPTEAKTATVKKSTAVKKAKTDDEAPAKKTTAKKPAKAPKIGNEERYRMIEVAAYYIAEKNGFKGSTLDYWTAAEAQVDAMLK
ncbi:MAG: DUF2934 domain-containing protein [Methylophilus sp.]|jgi:hypothetical protein